MTTFRPTNAAIPLDLIAVRAVLFDMDGLLLDSERIALAVFEQCAEAIALPDATPLFMQLIGVTDADSQPVIRAWFKQRGRTVADADAFFGNWMAGFHASRKSQPVPLKQGVLSLLGHLREHGHTCIVATSTETCIARDKLDCAGVLQSFDAVIGGERVTAGKPAPDIYRLAACEAGVLPEQCLVLEDSPNGVKAAVAAGAQTIQVPDLLRPDASLLALGHTVMASLDDVARLFRDP